MNDAQPINLDAVQNRFDRVMTSAPNVFVLR